jgi:hypothetical protein
MTQVQPDRPQMTIQYRAQKMRFECYKTKATRSECATIIAFSHQKKLGESVCVTINDTYKPTLNIG